MKVAKTLDEALQRLKREPGEPVRATVEGMTADVFAEIGPWEGETTEAREGRSR